jgi:hypothetical protein
VSKIAAILATASLVAINLTAAAADPLKVHLVPATQKADPWLSVTESTARDILQPTGDGPLATLQLTVKRIKVTDGKNHSVMVFVNTLRATAETPRSDPHFVGQASFFPRGADNPGFIMNPTPAIRRLAKAGALRLDRPLVFTFVIAPDDLDRPLSFTDWEIEGVSIDRTDRR